MPGTVLICGGGPTLFEDIRGACRQSAARMAINGVAGVMLADYLFTLHFEHSTRYAAQQSALRSAWGEIGSAPALIASPPLYGVFSPLAFPVTHWLDIAQRRATSGWAAIYAAIHCGYDEIVLCGVPLSGGDGNLPGSGATVGDLHPRGPSMARIQAAARRYAAALRRDHPTVCVHSMSGFTREILGLPQNVLDSPGE